MADWPYNTATWKRLRLAHLALFPMCEGCEAMGRMTMANTVDHRVSINAGGDPFPSHDGLASYCPGCHSAKTARGIEAGAVRTKKPRRGCNPDGSPIDSAHPWNGGDGLLSAAAIERRMPSDLRPARIPLTIVCGAPGSGKSTYVREHARSRDIVICLDTIMQQISGLPEHMAPPHLLASGLERRNAMLRALADDDEHAAAWFIVSAPKACDRRSWTARLGGRLIVMETPLAECVRRIRADAGRQLRVTQMVAAAVEWWAANPNLVRRKSLGAEGGGPISSLSLELVSSGNGSKPPFSGRG
ncbi:AAA family ATPase [Sphingobium olei]|uniref:AAA family ATPase n=1 Tax=Sphingobium olei TaxID=420955 RepID=A0ABW3P254_9SPHN